MYSSLLVTFTHDLEEEDTECHTRPHGGGTQEQSEPPDFVVSERGGALGFQGRM